MASDTTEAAAAGDANAAGHAPPPAKGAVRKPAVRPKATHRSVEHAVLLLVVIAGLPAALALLFLSWGQDYSFEVRWTITAVVLAVWIGAAIAAYQMVTRTLYLQANLLGALRRSMALCGYESLKDFQKAEVVALS